MNELIKLDESFNESMFISKANNIFIMLHTAVMMDDLNRVRHFLSNELEKKYEDILREYNNKNLRKMYDELNVKTNNIKNIEVRDNEAIIKVEITSRYMEYFVSKDTGNYISGNNDRRIEKINYLVFKKTIGNKYNNIARSCPGCGANINVNTNGKCDYCGAIFDAENYDWILNSIETTNI